MLFCPVVYDGSRVSLLCGHIAVFPYGSCEVLLYVFSLFSSSFYLFVCIDYLVGIVLLIRWSL